MADLIQEAPLTHSLEERVEYAVETVANMARLPWNDTAEMRVYMPVEPGVHWPRIEVCPRDYDPAANLWTVEFELPSPHEDDDHLLAHARLALRHAFERELLDLHSMVKHCGDDDGRYGAYIETAEQVLASLAERRLEAVSA